MVTMILIFYLGHVMEWKMLLAAKRRLIYFTMKAIETTQLPLTLRGTRILISRSVTVQN